MTTQAIERGEYRIVDLGIAHGLALREEETREQAAYTMGTILGGAAMGDSYYVRMLRCLAAASKTITGRPTEG